MATDVVTLSELLGQPDFLPPQRLEKDVESVLLRHLTARGAVAYPVTTIDLTTLTEKHVETLDLYADLSEYGDVEGATFFRPGAKPVVKIASALSEATNENRLRSTLAHEYGHVILHEPMYQKRAQQPSFEDNGPPVLQVSFRDGYASGGDLFEFQAWTVCGALLMPITELSRVVGGMAAAANHYSDISLSSDLGIRIHTFVAKHFGVSMDLARVRLLRTKVMTDKEPRPSLF